MNSNNLPDNIRRRMEPTQRKSMGVKTDSEIQAKVDSVSEREVQKQISNWLRLKGIWFAWSRMDKASRGVNGTPDYLLAYVYVKRWKNESLMRIAPLAIEVKVNKNVLSDEQIKVKEQMESNGWSYYVVSSLQEVMEIMKDTV